MRADPVRTRWSRHAPYVLLFVLIVALLLGAEWHMIRTINYESGDFAANSLLVQEAKRLHLIQGNYSRVGFNHPGPAILYVLAFGELVFHDWLHVVPSPFSGQIVAGILYNAAWLVLVCALVRRFTATLAPALLFVAVLVLALAGDDPAIITGLWFPDLYVFPFAALLCAIAPLAYGRADTLTPLAVASGFLINGHAAFVPMLGVILIVTVGANLLLARRAPERRILAPAWFAEHRRALRIALGILFLFFVPLIAATLRDFPGPIHDYLKFGHASKGNRWPAALNFVAVYWRGGPGPAANLVMAALLVPALMLGVRAERAANVGQAGNAGNAGNAGSAGFGRGARGLAIACIGATVAVVYYAKVGVDLLGEVYIALFYFSVPALCTALLALCICARLPAGARTAASAVLALAALGVVWQRVQTPLPYARSYSQPRIPELYRQLRALPGSGRLVLDFDQDSAVRIASWNTILGVQAYAARRHDDLLCIDAGWHISNTRPARCRPEERAANRRYFVGPDGAPDPVRGEPDAALLGLAFYRVGAAVRPATYRTVKDEPAYFKHILGKGWSNDEGDYVWSDGPVAELNLPADPARGRWLRLDLGGFLPVDDAIVRVRAGANGKPAGATVYSVTERRHRFPVDLGLDPGAAQHIVLTLEGIATPARYFPSSADTRRLGVSIYGIKKDSND